MLRALTAAIAVSLLVPASAFAAEVEAGEEKVTYTMFILIGVALILLAVVAILEARRQK